MDWSDVTVKMKTVPDSALRLLGEIVSESVRIFLLYFRLRWHFASKHVQFDSLRDIQYSLQNQLAREEKSCITGLNNEYLWHWISIISEMKVYDFSWCSSANRAQSTSAALQPASTHEYTDGWADEGKSGPEDNDVLNHDFCIAVLKIIIDTPTGGMMSTSSLIMTSSSKPNAGMKRIWGFSF